MPATTQFSNNSSTRSIDWRNRKSLPPDEPVTVNGHDERGFFRSRTAVWGDIRGNILPTPDGPLRIESVRRLGDQLILEEDLVPRSPGSLRLSLDEPLPDARTSTTQSDRWENELRRNHGRFSRLRVAEELADALSVLPQALLDLGLHDDSRECHWLIPERDAIGGILGIAVRYWHPWTDEQTGKQVTKGFRTGGHRGLYYSDDWSEFDGPVVSPEGFSDTAACLSLSLKTIGRPSAAGGKHHLLHLLAPIETPAPLIIIADRDVNNKGVNTGLQGARKTASLLARHLRRPVQVAFPPAGHKDTRQWLQRVTGGDLSPELLAAAREAFLEHLLSTAEIIHPGQHYELDFDDRPIVSLDEWREEMQQARIASVSTPGHYADFSPTGAGKSFADRALVQTALNAGKRVLLAVPTHQNCAEEVQQLREAGIEAVAYPELNTSTCQRYRDARFAVAQGLDLVRSVCSSCLLMHNNTCVYRQRIERARQADVAVCTTARLAMDTEASRQRDVITVHEAADAAICGQYVLGRKELEQARKQLHVMSGRVLRPDSYTESAVRRTEETRQFLRALVSLCDTLLEALKTGQRPEHFTPPDLPPGYWSKFVRQRLQEHHLSDQVLEQCEPELLPLVDDSIDGVTLRGLTMIVQGACWDVLVWPVETPRRRGREAKIIVQRRLAFGEGQVWWWQDATGEHEQLRQLIGQQVLNMTPDGRLEIRQQVEVVPIDISRKTAISKVVDAIRMEIIATGCERLGVIGHKVHIDPLKDGEAGLLSPEIRQRVHMLSYYGEGLDRASNQWLECDRLLILGTPRIGDNAIREELWRCGQREAAMICEPGWGEYTWEARLAGDPERTASVAGRSYSDPIWRAACLQVTRAAMRQALGRARAILDHGLPATIWTTEQLREYPVRNTAPPHGAIIDAVEVLWIASQEPQEATQRRGVRVDDDGRVWLTGAEIARRLERDKTTLCRVLSAAAEQGLVERGQRRYGWSIAADLAARS